jgi:aryl-alcohol dehydrogenase-like predicted oxidoreductase
MQKRKLGTQGLVVSEQGLGCMGMSEFYGPRDDAESLRTIDRALELGLDFLDTADVYGPFINEELVGKALRGRRDKLVLATKFGNVRTPEGAFKGLDGSPAYVRACAEASLKRLGVEVIDLYYQHRVDPKVPIEDTVGAMAELVKAGKVRYLGLSEAGPATIRRAHATAPISALQTEYSLWTRDPEGEILATVRELGIGFVAYSPLGRGFLTGHIKSTNQFNETDRRNVLPRFQAENLAKNLALVTRVQELAAARGVTPGQVALAWVSAQGEDIVPIPGTKRVKYVEENVAAAALTLSPAELHALDAAFPKGAATGDRYPDMSLVNR